MKVVAFAPDLMDRSRISAAAPDVRFVTEAHDLATAQEDLVLVDVSRPGVLDHLGASAGFVVGFGSHVDQATLDAASGAGCDLVLPRSKFFRRLDELIREDPTGGGR